MILGNAESARATILAGPIDPPAGAAAAGSRPATAASASGGASAAAAGSAAAGSLFDRLGGEAGVGGVVAGWPGRLVGDATLAHVFTVSG